MDLTCGEDIAASPELSRAYFRPITDDVAMKDVWSSPCAREGNAEALSHLVHREEHFRPRADYLDTVQSSDVVDAYVRECMVEYIAKGREVFGFSDLTISLAVNYLDRFLSIYAIKEEQKWVVQLAATASLSIASKMEEVKQYSLMALQEHAEMIFEAESVTKMERLVLDALKWEMNAVTCFSFLDRLVFAGGVHGHGDGEDIRAQAGEYLRGSYLEPEFLRYSASTMAAASILCSLGEAGDDTGPAMDALCRVTGVHPRVLRECLRMVENLLARGPNRSPVSVLYEMDDL